MKKKQVQKSILKEILKDIDKLLIQQTLVILNTVDVKLKKTRKEFRQEINKLRISIDKFVGFYTKQKQEFTVMKEHLKRLEARVVHLEAKLTYKNILKSLTAPE